MFCNFKTIMYKLTKKESLWSYHPKIFDYIPTTFILELVLLNILFYTSEFSRLVSSVLNNLSCEFGFQFEHRERRSRLYWRLLRFRALHPSWLCGADKENWYHHSWEDSGGTWPQPYSGDPSSRVAKVGECHCDCLPLQDPKPQWDRE